MTAEERKSVRNRALTELVDARDDEQAHCGRLNDVANRLERAVKAMRDRTLRYQVKNGKHLFFTAKDSTDTVPASHSFELPTVEEIGREIEACRAATEHRIKANAEAEATGVNQRYLD